jgi:hypothetical protein
MMKFSLKRLWFSVTGIAIGIGLLVFTFGHSRYVHGPKGLVPFFVGASLIGAGLLAPFRLAIVGAVIGFLVALGILFYALASMPRL